MLVLLISSLLLSVAFVKERHSIESCVSADVTVIGAKKINKTIQKERLHTICRHITVVKFNLDMGRLLINRKDFHWAKRHYHRKVNFAWTQCFPLYSMLLAMNRTTVDYFSLDVEGNELNVLKTIPFDKVDIKVMSIQFLHGPGAAALMKFLASKGYKEIVYLPGEQIVDWDIMVQKIDMK